MPSGVMQPMGVRGMPRFRERARAKSAGGKLRILVFKNERSVEVHAPGWKAPRIYQMTAFSGTLGPKLREGDGQIPEGIYKAPDAIDW